ncbi:plasma membrane calcium-transporting ATPase 4 [Nematostella vectensis]|uniref:plasma membrane calcium-transporting ATPase 4 n=1 Tax=Nematostella vectensis TaxID=45351 RepID=UPI0013900A88|nr:plasma membrane calcium-transporting ATPase 4 [Nematostella vectensis]
MPTTAPEIEEPGRLKTKLVEILTQKDGKGLQMLDDDFGGVRGIIHRLQTSSKKGILDTSDALARRTKSFGSNRISGQAKRRGFFRALLYSMTDIVLILLVLGGIASVILGYYYREVCKGKYIPDSEKNAWMEGAGILGTAAVIVLLSTLSDYLREKSFYRLQKRIESERKTRVMRGGEMKEICYQDVKVGDLCVIGPGSIIPADGILVENTELTTDESSLNKESRASKTSRDPFVFASTHVTEGSGKMIILAVGDSTQIAAITRQQPKQKVDDEFDPDDFRQTLHGKLTMASAILGLIGIIIGIIVGLVLLISFLVKTYEIDNIPYDASHWNEIIKTFIIAVVIIIVAEPEGLSMAVTITLSRSLRNMCAQDIFVRNADVLETMGSVTTLCCNKTGVLTAVSKIPLYEEVAECFVGGKHFRGDTSHYKSDIAVKVVHEVAKGIAINTSYNSNIQVSSSERNQVGDITECALLQFTADLGVYYPFIREANPCEEFSKVFPFSPETRSMTTVVKENATYKVYCKGSPEVVLPRCVRLLNMDEQEETLDADRLKKVNDIITAMQEKSQLKVMCLAYGTTPFKGEAFPPWENENDVAVGLTLAAVVGIQGTLGNQVAGSRMKVTEGRVIGKIPFSGPNFDLRVHAKALDKELVDDFCRSVAVNTSYLAEIQNEDNDKLPRHVGDPVDCALLEFVLQMGRAYQHWRDEYPEQRHVHEWISYSSAQASKQYRATAIKIVEKPVYKVYLKGGADAVLARCTQIVMNHPGEVMPMDDAQRENILLTLKRMQQRQLRVVAFAVREFTEEPNWDEENRILSDMHFVGFVGMEESVRGEVSEAILRCRRAGLMITMVTGASLQTAGSFAQNCGILTPNKYWPAVEKTIIGYDSKLLNEEISDDSGKISQVEFDKLWPDVRVVSRCTPEGKRSFMQAIRRSRVRREGEVVAVVASGVHDANFLRDADVGLSMGATGTDIAQEASDIVLKGDKFSSVLDTIKWGRHIYETVLKFLQFQLTATWVTMIVLIIGAILFQKSIFSAAQLLWLNLIMDALASLALTGDHPTDDILRHKPYGRNKPLISRAVLRNVIGHAIYQIAVVFIVIYLIADFTDTRFGYSAESLCRPTQHSTMVFTTFILMQLFNEVNCRRVSSRNVFSGPFDWVFLIVLLLCIGVQIIIVQFFTNSFRVEPLDWQQWLWCFFFGFSELIWGQIIFSVPKGVIPRFFRCCSRGVGPGTGGCCAALTCLRGIRSKKQRKSVLYEFYGAGHHASTRSRGGSANSVRPVV